MQIVELNGQFSIVIVSYFNVVEIMLNKFHIYVS
jgi:hypothetical protein